MTAKELIKYYQDINIDNFITFKRRGAEENVKIKILFPLVKFLGYDILRNTDFELKSIDIVSIPGNTELFLAAG